MKFRLVEDLEQKYRDFTIEIPYEDLNIEPVVGTSPAWWDGFRGVGGPAEDITKNVSVDYDYKIDWDEFGETVCEFLIDDEDYLNEIFEKLGFKKVSELTDEEFDIAINSDEMSEYLYDHADELLNRYIKQFRDAFEDSAVEKAEEEYEEEEPDWYDENIEKKNKRFKLTEDNNGTVELRNKVDGKNYDTSNCPAEYIKLLNEFIDELNQSKEIKRIGAKVYVADDSWDEFMEYPEDLIGDDYAYISVRVDADNVAVEDVSWEKEPDADNYSRYVDIEPVGRNATPYPEDVIANIIIKASSFDIKYEDCYSDEFSIKYSDGYYYGSNRDDMPGDDKYHGTLYYEGYCYLDFKVKIK